MRITSCPNSCKRCFVTIPSAIPVVRAYNSASAELRLTVCCVRDHAVSVVFPHCRTPPACAFARRCLACPIAVCVHVHELWRCNAFDQALCTWNAFQVPHDTLQVHLVGQVIFRAVSLTLYMMSARSWHMYNNFPTTVLCIARLLFSCSTSDSVVGVLFTLGVVTGFCFFQTKNSYHVSDVLRIRLHRVSSCRSLDHSSQEEDFVTCLLHCSCDPHQKLVLTRVQPVSEIHFSVQTANRHQYE